MNELLRSRVDEIIAAISEIPAVKGCSIYGSLAADTCDEMSDIDIEVDVSGSDNGKFMLELSGLLKDKLKIYYSDYAPSLVPDRYIVSVAIDENNPFLIADLCCSAQPHCTTVTRQQVAAENNAFTHMLKLWTANLKHYRRGAECRADISRMAGKIGIEDIAGKDEAALLEETLCWLESNADSGLKGFVESCRKKFEEAEK